MNQSATSVTFFSESKQQESEVGKVRNKPNVVFIMADDMGFGDLGFYGNNKVTTPVLDNLASKCVCMNQHYSAAPICAPARAAFLTGQYPYRTGQDMSRTWRGISPKSKTIAQYFSNSDYATALIGKWHLNGKPGCWTPPENMPWNMGFNECAMIPPFSDYWNWNLECKDGFYKKSDGRYLTDALTDEAINFIERHENENFFLFLAYNAPHYPLQARKEDLEIFENCEGITDGAAITYAMIRRMDFGIGRVLETLKDKGLEENTIVIFTSDNGPYLGMWEGKDQNRYNGYLNGGKGLILDGGIRVPAMISWPAGLPEESRACTDLIHITDWLPTLLAACGIDSGPESDFDGVNVLPVLHGSSPMIQIPRFWSWNYNFASKDANTAMRDGCWKLVRPFLLEISGYSTEPAIDMEKIPEPYPLQLFRLDVDPYERNDLSTLFPERVRDMNTKMENWFEKVMHDFNTMIDW